MIGVAGKSMKGPTINLWALYFQLFVWLAGLCKPHWGEDESLEAEGGSLPLRMQLRIQTESPLSLLLTLPPKFFSCWVSWLRFNHRAVVSGLSELMFLEITLKKKSDTGSLTAIIQPLDLVQRTLWQSYCAYVFSHWNTKTKLQAHQFQWDNKTADKEGQVHHW